MPPLFVWVGVHADTLAIEKPSLQQGSGSGLTNVGIPEVDCQQPLHGGELLDIDNGLVLALVAGAAMIDLAEVVPVVQHVRERPIG